MSKVFASGALTLILAVVILSVLFYLLSNMFAMSCGQVFSVLLLLAIMVAGLLILLMFLRQSWRELRG